MKDKLELLAERVIEKTKNFLKNENEKTTDELRNMINEFADARQITFEEVQTTLNLMIGIGQILETDKMIVNGDYSVPILLTQTTPSLKYVIIHEFEKDLFTNMFDSYVKKEVEDKLEEVKEKIVYIYDELNENNKVYIQVFDMNNREDYEEYNRIKKY